MIYRRKMYKVNSSIVEEFNQHFNQTLLLTQLKYGSRLVGRWMKRVEEIHIVEVFAIWEYDSYENYEVIENKVRSDQEHVARVQSWYQKLGGKEKLREVFFEIDQDFIENTVDSKRE